jgi:hypothetical protein
MIFVGYSIETAVDFIMLNNFLKPNYLSEGHEEEQQNMERCLLLVERFGVWIVTAHEPVRTVAQFGHLFT